MHFQGWNLTLMGVEYALQPGALHLGHFCLSVAQGVSSVIEPINDGARIHMDWLC